MARRSPAQHVPDPIPSSSSSSSEDTCSSSSSYSSSSSSSSAPASRHGARQVPSYGFWSGDISQPPPDTQGPLRPFSDKTAKVQLLIAADPLGFMWHHSDTLSRLGVVTFSDIRRLTVHDLTAAAIPRLDALRIMFARRLFDSSFARLHGVDCQVGDTVNSRLRNYHYLGFLMPVSQPLHASQSYYNRSCLVRLGGLEVPPARRAPIDLSQTLPFSAQFLYLGEWIVVNVLATSAASAETPPRVRIAFCGGVERTLSGDDVATRLRSCAPVRTLGITESASRRCRQQFVRMSKPAVRGSSRRTVGIAAIWPPPATAAQTGEPQCLCPTCHLPAERTTGHLARSSIALEADYGLFCAWHRMHHLLRDSSALQSVDKLIVSAQDGKSGGPKMYAITGCKRSAMFTNLGATDDYLFVGDGGIPLALPRSTYDNLLNPCTPSGAFAVATPRVPVSGMGALGDASSAPESATAGGSASGSGGRTLRPSEPPAASGRLGTIAEQALAKLGVSSAPVASAPAPRSAWGQHIPQLPSWSRRVRTNSISGLPGDGSGSSDAVAEHEVYVEAVTACEAMGKCSLGQARAATRNLAEFRTAVAASRNLSDAGASGGAAAIPGGAGKAAPQFVAAAGGLATQLQRPGGPDPGVSSARGDNPIAFWNNKHDNFYLSNWSASPFTTRHTTVTEVRSPDGTTSYIARCLGEARFCGFLSFASSHARLFSTAASSGQGDQGSASHSMQVNFSTVEHFLMCAKASFFRDWKSFFLIARSTSPAEAKRLGRGVSSYDDARWSAVRARFLYLGLLCKFSANSEARHRLLATGLRRLVEASPHDKIYGAGFDPDQIADLHPLQFTGGNLLGEMLMVVRGRFACATGNGKAATAMRLSQLARKTAMKADMRNEEKMFVRYLGLGLQSCHGWSGSLPAHSPGSHALVWMSPPCQGFSGARAASSSSSRPDPRTRHMSICARFIAKTQPLLSVIENVPAALKHPAWRQHAKPILEGAGRRVVEVVLHAHMVGLALDRTRCFIVTMPACMPDFVSPIVASFEGLGYSLANGIGVRDVIPGILHFYSHRRYQSFPGTYSADKRLPGCLTSCLNPPRRPYRPHADDSVCLGDAYGLGIDDMKTLMGFPYSFRLPPLRVRCSKCSACNQVVPTAARLVGNSVCPPMAEFLVGILKEWVDTNTKFTLSAIDCYCGVGGASHGIARAGVPVVAAFDICPYAVAFHNQNAAVEHDDPYANGQHRALVYSKASTTDASTGVTTVTVAVGRGNLGVSFVGGGGHDRWRVTATPLVMGRQGPMCIAGVKAGMILTHVLGTPASHLSFPDAVSARLRVTRLVFSAFPPVGTPGWEVFTDTDDSAKFNVHKATGAAYHVPQQGTSRPNASARGPAVNASASTCPPASSSTWHGFPVKPTCIFKGCERPAFGSHAYCGLTHARMHQRWLRDTGAPLCGRDGCRRPCFQASPTEVAAYCSAACAAESPSDGDMGWHGFQMPAICIRPGCARRAHPGSLFCGRRHMREHEQELANAGVPACALRSCRRPRLQFSALDGEHRFSDFCSARCKFSALQQAMRLPPRRQSHDFTPIAGARAARAATADTTTRIFRPVARAAPGNAPRRNVFSALASSSDSDEDDAPGDDIGGGGAAGNGDGNDAAAGGPAAHAAAAVDAPADNEPIADAMAVDNDIVSVAHIAASVAATPMDEHAAPLPPKEPPPPPLPPKPGGRTMRLQIPHQASDMHAASLPQMEPPPLPLPPKPGGRFARSHSRRRAPELRALGLRPPAGAAAAASAALAAKRASRSAFISERGAHAWSRLTDDVDCVGNAVPSQLMHQRLLSLPRRRANVHVGETLSAVGEALRRHDAAANAHNLRHDSSRLQPDTGDGGRLRRDPDCTRGHVHISGLRRSERKRLAAQMQTALRDDGMCRDTFAPLWRDVPAGAPPSDTSPAAMYASAPARHPDAGADTHPCEVSQRHERWAVAHMGHCSRCQAFSKRTHGVCPPVDELRNAWRGGPQPLRAWSLDPACYQRELLRDLRCGFDPAVQRPIRPVVKRNGPSCHDQFGEMLKYWDKLRPLGCMSEGVWNLPAGAVVNAMHCVSRPSDVRRAERDPAFNCPVRVVTDFTASSVNECFSDWRFRMGGMAQAVRLLSSSTTLSLGSVDISKFFPRCPAGRVLQQSSWIRDPRASSSWQGTGPPSAEWLQWRAHLRRTGQRVPPFRRWTGVPLGFKLAPAFACSVSSEMGQMFAALGIRAAIFVDDILIVADDPVTCAEHIKMVEHIIEWLGLKVADGKTEGPAPRLKFLGLLLDPQAGQITVTPDRAAAILGDVARLLASSSVLVAELETILGKLGFIAMVCRGGRAYLQRLRAHLNNCLRNGMRRTTLGQGALADLEWWRRTLSSDVVGSPICMMDNLPTVIPMKSDASGSIGFGYQFGDVMHFSRFSDDTAADEHINYKEMLALVHLAEEYGQLLTGKVLRCGVDNSSVVFNVLRGASACPATQALLRRLADAQCLHNFEIICSHVSREYNEVADLLTRFARLQEFDAFLPSNVAVGGVGSMGRCLHDSPARNEPVFYVKLQSQRAPTSQTPQKPRTAGSRSPSSRSAPGWDSRGSSGSCRSTPTSSSTSPPNTATTPTPRSWASSRLGAGTRTSTTCSSPRKFLGSSHASGARSKAVSCAILTQGAATRRSHCRSSTTSPRALASPRSTTTSLAPSPRSASWHGYSSVTRLACARWSTLAVA